MDDNPQSADSPAPSPAKGRPATNKKASGKGTTKKNPRKQVPPKRGEATVRRGNRGKGRGRTKFYDDPRVQAAHERQKELRDIYSMVASVVKPALEALADISIKEDPMAHKAVPEYEILMNRLDTQLQDVIRTADEELKMRTALTARTYDLDTKLTDKKFLDSFNYTTEEFYDAALNRVTILAELRREGCGLNLVDGSYSYQSELDDILAEQGPYVVFRDGIKIPFPSLLEENKKTVIKGNPRKTKPATKRKAEDQADGQPDPKKPTTASGSFKMDNGDDASTPRPRHIGGLLSAENVPDGEPESNAPSPTPLNEDNSPSSESKASATVKRKDIPDLPSGASDADAWGVRTVIRRGPRANNRLIIPPTIEWEDDEIGFRDSTNDSTRKATRATRGKFLNKPNSRNFHLDQTIVTYNCLAYEDGDLDQSVVKKHRLHPKYGFFLPDSVNEAELPGERVDGTRPVIILTPNGSTLHASRTVRAMKMDHALETDARKERLASMLGDYCEKEDVEPDEIVTEEMRERQRQALERLVSTADLSEDDYEGFTDEAQDAQSTMTSEKLAREGTEHLLHAAAYLEMDRPLLAPAGQRPSRPYDAVRDVFTNAEPEPSTPMPPVEVDTTGLSCLADVAEHVSYKYEKQPEFQLLQLEPRTEHRPEYQPMMHLDYRPEPLEMPNMGDSSMIDPRLLGPANQLPVAPPNAFLQTALNPTPSFTHIAPAPAPGLETPTQPPPTRNPFTNQGGAKGSPVLPPLRPTRRDRAAETQQPPVQPVPAQPQPQEFGSPHGMIQTNSGNFYPPAPARPFHQSYSIHEPPLMPLSMQQGAPISGPGMMPNQHQPPPPPSHMTPYPMLSPPMQSQAQLASHMGPAPSVSPPNPPMGGPPPPGHNSRHRTSIPSNGNGSGKYRKIAAAPIPHNRPWPANGGSELRLAHYDHKEAIKDYRANEPPPRTGPTTIRGWNVNNVSKGRNRGVKKEDSEEKDSPNITPFINKWNPSEKSIG